MHPVKALQALAAKIMEHWETGYGSTYNETRKEALSLVRLERDLDSTLVRTDLLWEALMIALRTKPWLLVSCVWWLVTGGRAAVTGRRTTGANHRLCTTRVRYHGSGSGNIRKPAEWRPRE